MMRHGHTSIEGIQLSELTKGSGPLWLAPAPVRPLYLCSWLPLARRHCSPWRPSFPCARHTSLNPPSPALWVIYGRTHWRAVVRHAADAAIKRLSGLRRVNSRSFPV